VGRLTRDPEIKRVNSGTAVAEIGLAVNRYYTQDDERKEEVSFFDVVIWGKRAETFVEYTEKGSEVLIDGYLKQDRWENDQGEKRSKIRVVCNNFQFLGGKSKAGSKSQSETDPETSFDDPGEVPF